MEEQKNNQPQENKENFFTKSKEKVVEFYNKNKNEKWFRWGAIALIALFIIIIGVSIATCDSSGGVLSGDNARAYNKVRVIFEKIDNPEEADVTSGCIDQFGDGYFAIEYEDGSWNKFLVENGKVYDTYSVIMYFGDYSYEYMNMARLCLYEDPNLDYDAINKALDKKFN